MRWRGGRESGNIEDRRGIHPAAIGGGVGAVVLAIVAMLLGVDPREVLQQSGDTTAPPASQVPAPNDTMRQFIATVLGSTEDVWGQAFQQAGGSYQQPKLVLFTDAVQSACGFAQAAMGPFYCPGDERVYLDLGFFRELRERFGAPGEFAEAYVVAHEVGHHVQNLLGIEQRVHAAMEQSGKAEANALSVRLELQADCLAGVWGYHADKSSKILEAGDLEEALRAASAIGDDRIMKQNRGTIVPDSFTHGTSEQRVRWFKKGFETGDLNQCDTFKAASL